MLMGEFKQEILRINNKVNMEVFRQGVLTQKADVCGDKVLIVAKNRRVMMLSLFDDMDRPTTEIMDRLLIAKFKKRFIEAVEQELGIKVLGHLKDYDPELEISVSVTLFDRPIDELLPELTLSKNVKNKWSIP